MLKHTWFRPLGQRLARHRFAGVVLALLGLIAIAVAITVNGEHDRRVQLHETAQAQAQILANSITAALSFDDIPGVLQNTNALRASKQVEAAGVYGLDGKLVAVYGVNDLPENAAALRTVTSQTALDVAVPVEEAGAKLGTVYLRFKPEPLATRLPRYTGPALLLIVAMLVLSVMAVDARELQRRNDRLTAEIAERERVEAVLRQSQKMEAIGRLTGGIAHDFNNMLAVIVGNLDLLLRRFPNADPLITRFVVGAQDAARRSATLTQRLLAFSRRQALSPKTIDPGFAVAEMADLLQRTIGQAIEMTILREPQLWNAKIDQAQFETAIINLAVNAKDAMPKGGSLIIEASNAHVEKTMSIGIEDINPGDYVRIRVSDTGTGMPKEVIEHIFEPFFTTKPVGLGTGLGLSQVHGFVKQSGGHVCVESEVGAGTSFVLFLPRSVDDMPDRGPVDGLDTAKKHLVVLVVDDEAGVRDFTAEAAVELGYDVLRASSAKEAIAIADRNQVDCLLTDLVMPVTNGRELAATLRQSRPVLPVIFMTGFSRDTIVESQPSETDTYLLRKPFSFEQLADQLKAATTRIQT